MVTGIISIFLRIVIINTLLHALYTVFKFKFNSFDDHEMTGFLLGTDITIFLVFVTWLSLWHTLPIPHETIILSIATAISVLFYVINFIKWYHIGIINKEDHEKEE